MMIPLPSGLVYNTEVGCPCSFSQAIISANPGWPGTALSVQVASDAGSISAMSGSIGQLQTQVGNLQSSLAQAAGSVVQLMNQPPVVQYVTVGLQTAQGSLSPQG